MFNPVFSSFILHVVIGVAGYLGWPVFKDDKILLDETIMVEVVTIDETTNIPDPVLEPPEPEPKPKPKPKEELSRAPEAKPLKEELLPELIPEPEPEPEPQKKVKPEPVIPAPKPLPKLAKAKSLRKPKPPKQFKVAALKNLLADIKKTQPKKERDPVEDTKKSFRDKIAKAISRPKKKFISGKQVTISEIDAVRQQIMRCWNVPAGAKNAKDIQIEIFVSMNPDGTVRTAKIKDVERLFSDAFFRTAAESARRAVLNPRCSPFKLPREKYSQWRTITLNFNPREMF